MSTTVACAHDAGRAQGVAEGLVDVERESTREYWGDVRPRGEVVGTKPVYQYERRVDASGLRASHVTRDADGGLAVVQTANWGSDGQLREFVSASAQTGVIGRAHVSEDGVMLVELERDGRVRRRREVNKDPVVVGPTLFAFARDRLGALRAGETVPLRFVVPDRGRSYGFELVAEQGTGTRDDVGATVVVMRAQSRLLRRAIPDMLIVFDDATLKVRRYEGAVPPVDPKRQSRALEARVDYRG